MSIDTQQEQEAKVRKDLNMPSRFCRKREQQKCPILKILTILAILLQTVDIKVLTDLFLFFASAVSIDIKVFQTFAPCETNERAPHTDAAGASDVPHPGHPGHPANPASDVIAIKVLTDLYVLLRRRCYRH